MDKSKFTNPQGRLVSITIPLKSYAFIPEPLTTKWDTPQELRELSIRAREELARLDGLGRYLPDYSLLLTPLKRREALRSSSIEGTFATPEQLLMFDWAAPSASSSAYSEVREVSKYNSALDLGVSGIDGDQPLSQHFTRALHETLMTGMRGGDKSPGKFRDIQVVVGVGGRYIPPPPQLLPECLEEFETHQLSSIDEIEIDPLIRCFMAHYQFEAIHPFKDGNGRVGRLLLALSIYKWMALSKPWLYMSAFFEKHKDDYIDLMFNVSATGGWEEWIRFCLTGVVEQSKDSMKRIENILSLKDKYMYDVRQLGGAGRLSIIVDHLFHDQVVSIPQVREMLSVSYPTAKQDVEILVKRGVLRRSTIKHRGAALFVAGEILSQAYDDIS